MGRRRCEIAEPACIAFAAAVVVAGGVAAADDAEGTECESPSQHCGSRFVALDASSPHLRPSLMGCREGPLRSQGHHRLHLHELEYTACCLVRKE